MCACFNCAFVLKAERPDQDGWQTECWSRLSWQRCTEPVSLGLVYHSLGYSARREAFCYGISAIFRRNSQLQDFVYTISLALVQSRWILSLHAMWKSTWTSFKVFVCVNTMIAVILFYLVFQRWRKPCSPHQIQNSRFSHRPLGLGLGHLLLNLYQEWFRHFKILWNV